MTENDSKPNLLILGGSYFIGRVFIEKLLPLQQYNIYVLNRGSVPLRLDGVTQLVADRHDQQQLEQAIPHRPWQAVIDFSAYTATDIHATLKALKQHQISQYIYISSAAVYRPCATQPVDESATTLNAPQPELGAAADYGFNKRQAELALIEHCQQQEISYTLLRPTFVFGKYNYAPRESYFFEQILQHNKIVIPDRQPPACFSFASVWDVARITTACIANPAAANQIFNVAGDETLSYAQLAKTFKRITAIDFEIERLSVSQINHQQIPLPFPLDRDFVFYAERSKQLLAHQYIPFDDAMAETYRLYRLGHGLDD